MFDGTTIILRSYLVGTGTRDLQPQGPLRDKYAHRATKRKKAIECCGVQTHVGNIEKSYAKFPRLLHIHLCYTDLTFLATNLSTTIHSCLTK
jgi:hypothetical protein